MWREAVLQDDGSPAELPNSAKKALDFSGAESDKGSASGAIFVASPDLVTTHFEFSRLDSPGVGDSTRVVVHFRNLCRTIISLEWFKDSLGGQKISRTVSSKDGFGIAQTGASLAIPRSYVGVATYNGQIYVVGGIDNNGNSVGAIEAYLP